MNIWRVRGCVRREWNRMRPCARLVVVVWLAWHLYVAWWFWHVGCI